MGTKQRAARAEGLTASQVKILQVLAKSSVGLTAHAINHIGRGVPVNCGTIGPVFDGPAVANYPQSLKARGMVRAEQYEGDDVVWFITDKGRKYTGFKAQKIGSELRVPNEIIDPIVLAFKKTRTYGLERYDNDDIEQLREKLPEEFRAVDVTDLWNQILARRKQGAFADPNEKRRKAFERLLREFGPDGTMIPDFLTEDQMGVVYSALGYDASSERVEVEEEE